MQNDIILNKIQTIDRCIARIDEEFDDESKFRKNYTKQDSVILNLERASQASIDLATHIIKIKKLGIPNSSREQINLRMSATTSTYGLKLLTTNDKHYSIIVGSMLFL